MPMEVQITFRKSIKPLFPTPFHLRKHNLSFIDELNFPCRMNSLLYYPISGAVDDHVEENLRRRHQLQKSLSEMLTVYYPLAGRLVQEEGLFVDCNDEGVEYLEAEVNWELSSILGEMPDAKLLSEFIPSDIPEGDSPTAPLLAVQISSFRCGGLAVAVQYNHRIADGATMMGFLNAWATASRLGLGAVTRPSFELASHAPPRSSQCPKRSTFRDDIITKRFIFNGPAISALKAKAQRQTTRVQIVLGLVWKALICVVQARNKNKRTWVLELAVNLRGKTIPPMPNNSFGNFYTSSHAQFRGDANTVQLQDMVGFIANGIKKTLSDCKKPLYSDEFCSAMDYSYTVADTFRANEEVDFRMFTSWCSSQVYEADFGWGKPSWTSGWSFPVEMVVLMDTKKGDGVEAWVSLIEQDMLEFQKDQDVITFTSC